MRQPAEYDDYLRRACGLDLLDGPPPTLTLDQARVALLALAADADKYKSLLLRAGRPHPRADAMSYYPTFNKCQDMGLELLNKEAGIPLAFGDRQRTRIVQVYLSDKKVTMWAGNRIVYSGYPDSEYDFNTLWEELVTSELPPIE